MKITIHPFLNLLFIFVALNQSAFCAESNTIGIFVPYVGKISNSYENPSYHLKLNETGSMTGVYAQWINPDYFQANTFFYFAPRAEMTDVVGLHLNADYYPTVFSFGKLAAGIDIEAIKIHTAGALIGIESFEMHNTVATCMPRIGLSVPVLTQELIKITAFPYAGATYENVSGDVSVDPTGPAPKRTSPISLSSTYASLGLNLTLRLSHIFELQTKYLAGLKSSARLDSISVLLNIYLSRNFAISYRFKSSDLPERTNQFHLIGLAVVI